MAKLGDYFQTADWKTEKHVPVIECPDAVSAGEPFQIEVSVGKEVPHPNTTEHHIRWIQVFFQPSEEKATYQLANLEFCTHGEAVKGANEGPAYTEPMGTVTTKVNQSGTIMTLSYCNIHGLWENSKDISVT